MEDADNDFDSETQRQRFNASETDADVGPWQPKVLAAGDAEETDLAAGAATSSLPAHMQASLQCCSGSMTWSKTGVLTVHARDPVWAEACF